MTAGRLLAASVAVISSLPNVVFATITPSATASGWLEQMNLAVRTLNYEGRFVYQHGGHLEALYLRHVVTERGEHERLQTLNGVPREVVRDIDQVTCSHPQHGNVNLDRRKSSTGFSPLLPIRTATLIDHYEFKLGDRTRVAGRQAQEVHIRPRDGFRYGYSLALDLQHALPLRTTMQDAHGRLVSQIMFTDLEVGIAANDGGDANHHAVENPPSGRLQDRTFNRDESWSDPPQWRFDRTPAGFALHVHRRHTREDKNAIVEHFIFTDGLATVSVYVEPAKPDALEGAAQVGPVNAFGLRLDGHSVTAVGEVPAITVRSFGQAVVASSSADP